MALVSRTIDVADRSTATITFWWYIEKGLDTGEYLRRIAKIVPPLVLLPLQHCPRARFEALKREADILLRQEDLSNITVTLEIALLFPNQVFTVCVKNWYILVRRPLKTEKWLTAYAGSPYITMT